jgi:hypothetical protein
MIEASIHLIIATPAPVSLNTNSIHVHQVVKRTKELYTHSRFPDTALF